MQTHVYLSSEKFSTERVNYRSTTIWFQDKYVLHTESNISQGQYWLSHHLDFYLIPVCVYAYLCMQARQKRFHACVLNKYTSYREGCINCIARYNHGNFGVVPKIVVLVRKWSYGQHVGHSKNYAHGLHSVSVLWFGISQCYPYPSG